VSSAGERIQRPRECNGPECRRLVFRAGLCRGHYWQRQQGRPLKPLAPRRQSRAERLAAAALAYADAETPDDYERAQARLRMAWRDPKRCACGRRVYRAGKCFRHARAESTVLRT